MPIELSEFPVKEKKQDRYKSLFDGKMWKVHPSEYDYDVEDIKAFIASIKNSAAKQKIYLKTFITADDHVILSKQPDGYIPRKITRKKKENELVIEHIGKEDL